MSAGIVTAAYIAASVLFILALGGLSNQEKAKRAVWFGIVGMGIAVFATIFGPGVGGWSYLVLIPLMGVGAFLGATVAKRVEMTEMPAALMVGFFIYGFFSLFSSPDRFPLIFASESCKDAKKGML
jgi:NAD(P) transhydrogenase subunit beta